MVHLQEEGFDVASVTEADRATLQAVRERHGVPVEALSCHTATVGRYVVEGHVPASVIRRLLREAPDDVVGLAVPGMPPGSPGMEVHGDAPPFDILAIRADGTLVPFARSDE